MPSSRRQFLKGPVLGLLGAAAVGRVARADTPKPPGSPPAPPAGQPPAFGTGPAVGPPITAGTIAEAEKLMQVSYTAAERGQAAGNWRVSMAPLYERRTGPRKVALDPTVSPASHWNPALPGLTVGPARNRFVRSPGPPGKPPAASSSVSQAASCTPPRALFAACL